jgi:hypothetical protein
LNLDQREPTTVAIKGGGDPHNKYTPHLELPHSLSLPPFLLLLPLSSSFFRIGVGVGLVVEKG